MGSALSGGIYLDWNATTPPCVEALEAMARAAREAWGNPASLHATGRRARGVVEDARGAIAELVGADVRDVVLTSGGTEANNLALRSAFARASGVLVTSRLEHPSVTRVAEALEREGRARVRWLHVLASGQIDVADVERAVAEPGVRLVAVAGVNHETGVLQPLEEVFALARARRVPVHVDSVQTFGRVVVDVAAASTKTLAAHKIRGPKGIGALVSVPGVELQPVLLGGAQERGLRPGTVDPVAAAGFAAAARLARGGAQRYAAVAPRRDRLEAALVGVAGLVNGTAARAPHVTNVSFPGWSGAEVVAALDLEGVFASSGSACSAGTPEPSPVIAAMLGPERAARAVRFSLGEETDDEAIDRAIATIRRVLARGGRAP